METLKPDIQKLVWFAGLAQVGLVLGSLAIPTILKWKVELSKVQPLIRQMFWVYAAYIVGINLCFGFISIFDYKELTNSSGLAMLITAFIAVYWISRVLIQFFYFDRATFPAGKWNKLGEAALVAVFIFLSIVYCYAFYINYTHH